MSEKITSASIASFGEELPLGSFTAKLTKIEAKESENGTNWIQMAVELLDGEGEGLTATLPIFAKVTKSPKNGKFYSRGIFEAQSMASSWGSPLPEFDLDDFIAQVTPKGARLLQKLLADSFKKAGSPKLKVRIVDENVQEKGPDGKWGNAKNEDGTPKLRKKTVVVGRATPKAVQSDISEGDGEADSMQTSMSFVN